MFLLRCHWHNDVWSNSFFVNHLMARRVIFGSRQAEGRSVLHRQDALNRTFAEGLFTQDDRPLHILQATGDNFRRAGTPAVDHDYDWKIWVMVASACLVF